MIECKRFITQKHEIDEIKTLTLNVTIHNLAKIYKFYVFFFASFIEVFKTTQPIVRPFTQHESETYSRGKKNYTLRMKGISMHNCCV